ncbi:MAG: glycosyltransferase family 10 domain-containing protein [Gemmiger sp.]
MPPVKLAFCDLAPDWDPCSNYFTRALQNHGRAFEIVEKDPDFVLCGTFGHDFLRYDCVRIHFSGEDSWPDLNLYDYAMGFPLLEYGDRYLRLPLYAMRETWAPALAKHTLPDEAFLGRRQFCSFVVSNDFSHTRNEVFAALNAHRPVASGGQYQNNVGGPVADKQAFLQNYRFNLAFENSASPGYCTEKIVDAFAAGAVPIYWGDPEILGEFNPDAFVWAGETPDIPALLALIDAIDGDKERYLALCRAPILRDGCRAARYVDDSACFAFLDGIFQKGTGRLRRNRSCWGTIYENDLRYYHRLAEDAARPKSLLQRLGLR